MGDLNFTPRTWSGMVTGAQMNTDIRDSLEELQAPWVDYAAVWTGVSSNPAIGNGTIDASYHRVGKTVSFLIKVTMGSSTTYGSGQWRITLPFPAAITRWRVPVDLLAAGSAYAGTAVASTTTYLGLNVPPLTGGNADRAVTSAVPATWVSGDSFTVAGTYETA